MDGGPEGWAKMEAEISISVLLCVPFMFHLLYTAVKCTALVCHVHIIQ